MTKQELEQLKDLKNEIRLLKDELRNIESSLATDTVTGSSRYMPWAKHIITITGIDSKKYDRLQRKFNRKVQELEDEMDRLNEYIDSIDDSEMRQIMQLRYRNGLGWGEIGAELGYDRTTVAKKLNEFLRLEDGKNEKGTTCKST